VATCFDQLQGHPLATRKQRIKITIARIILGKNELSILLLHKYINKFKTCSKSIKNVCLNNFYFRFPPRTENLNNIRVVLL
jgi:hypothetical protein